MGRASRAGDVAVRINPRQTSSSALGGESGNHGSGGSGFGGCGNVSCSRVMISVPCSTSIAAWCSLVSSAKLFLGRSSRLSRPSMTYISHSGRWGSSGRAWMREAWMQNWRQSPGVGSAMLRTWYSRSKFSSSIQ